MISGSAYQQGSRPLSPALVVAAANITMAFFIFLRCGYLPTVQ